jgi:hypothetical protein
MATVLKVNVKDLDIQFFEDLGKRMADLSFEPLLYLADRAYQLKTGREFEYSPTLSYETKNGRKPRGNVQY